MHPGRLALFKLTAQKNARGAGMAADKRTVSAVQASALGMLSPAAGVAALEALLRGARLGSAAAVRGAAGAVYWRRLLQGVRTKPGLFAALEAAPAPDQVPTLLRLLGMLLHWHAKCFTCSSSQASGCR